MTGKEMEWKFDFLVFCELGTVRSVLSDRSGVVYEGRAWKTEGSACVERFAASPGAELLAETKKAPIVA